MAHDNGGWSGTGPHVEANYGVLPNGHLHLLTPLVFLLPDEGTGRYGYGDTELGVKFRFIQETDWRPMVGIFPIVELPSGDSKAGLGSGRVQTSLPVWIQKSFGDWTTYGGGGYWINPGTGNRDYWFFRGQVQRKIAEHVAAGVEVFHTTPREVDGGGRGRGREAPPALFGCSGDPRVERLPGLLGLPADVRASRLVPGHRL